jgi:integrase/recombinase XerD
VLHVIEQALAVPMKRFDRPLLRFLSREEMQAILDAPDRDSWAGQRDRALFTTLYNTGARVSEVLHLRLEDLILEEGSPAVHLHGKGRKQRSVLALEIHSHTRPLLEATPEGYC